MRTINHFLLDPTEPLQPRVMPTVDVDGNAWTLQLAGRIFIYCPTLDDLEQLANDILAQCQIKRIEADQ